MTAPPGIPSEIDIPLPEPLTTEELAARELARLDDQINALEQEIVGRDFTVQIPATETDQFGQEVTVRDAQGNIVFTDVFDTRRFNDTVTALDVLLARRNRIGPEQRSISPNVAAQITEQRAARQQAGEEFGEREQRLREEFEIEEKRRRDEFEASLAEQEAGRAQAGEEFGAREERLAGEAEARGQREAAALEESQRATNILGTLDLLENEIRIGNLGVAEASNRFSAATNAAGIQRDVLSRFGGQNLPAGTEFFPNLGPTGPIAAAASALGIPFGGFETMGTFGINPAQLAQTIPAALGPSVVPGARGALQNAAASLAGLGIPPPTPAGRQARTPQIGQQQAALSLAGF